MKIRNALLLTLALLATVPLLVGPSHAQAPASAAKAAKAAKATKVGKGKAAMPPQANLGQLMKGIFYPNSNVIFAAQNDNPADVKPAADASTAPNPLESAYGGWEAVENSGLAIADAAPLLLESGRKCANGLAVPVNNADWLPFVQELRAAGMKAYQAAKSKNQDNILDAADAMVTACANCHDRYREKENLADRCK